MNTIMSDFMKAWIDQHPIRAKMVLETRLELKWKPSKKRKGFTIDDSKQNKIINAWVSVPVYSRNESNEIVGCVKSFLEVRL